MCRAEEGKHLQKHGDDTNVLEESEHAREIADKLTWELSSDRLLRLPTFFKSKYGYDLAKEEKLCFGSCVKRMALEDDPDRRFRKFELRNSGRKNSKFRAIYYSLDDRDLIARAAEEWWKVNGEEGACDPGLVVHSCELCRA